MDELASGYGLLEGPTRRPRGWRLLQRRDPGRGVPLVARGSSEVVPKRRGIGGIALHEDGGVVVTGRDVVHVREGDTRVVLDARRRHRLQRPRRRPGRLVYVGALRFMPFAGEEPVPGEIWRIPAQGESAPVAGGVLGPNGIGFSPDGRTVYGSDYARRCVYRGSRCPADRCRRRGCSRSCRQGRRTGWRWTKTVGYGWRQARPGVWRAFRPDGSLDRTLDVPASFVSSLCFGGDDMRDVYVTTGDGKLLRGRSDVPGLAAHAGARVASRDLSSAVTRPGSSTT